MTTPSPSAPQEVPQWAKDAANEIHPPVGLGRDADRREFIASIIARHAQTALTAAASELAELRKDRERLDWLEGQKGILMGQRGHNLTQVSRAAIDAAMRKEGTT